MTSDFTHGASDLLRSILFGPFRSLVPAFLNICLYPIMAAHGGLHTIGLWATFNLVIGIFLLGDLGISQHISRRATAGAGDAADVRGMSEVTLSLWLGATAILAVIMLIWSEAFFGLVSVQLNILNIVSLMMVIFAGALALACGLFAYLHISLHRLNYAQVNDTLTSFVQFILAASLLYLIQPIPALAIALFARYLSRAVGLYLSLRKIGYGFAPRSLALPTRSYLWETIQGSKGFALLSASQQLVHIIVNRSVVLALAGTSVLGAFETVSRIPFVLEQASSNGLLSLFSLFAKADWQSDQGRNRLRLLVQWVSRLIAVLGVGALSAWIVLAGPALGLWLNLHDPQIVLAAQLFGTFNAVRAFNIPTYWALQARHNEGLAGAIYAGQVVIFVVCAFSAAAFAAPSLLLVASLIAALSIAAELILLIAAQVRLGYLSIIVTSWRDGLPLLGSLTLIISGWAFAAPPVSRSQAIHTAISHGLAYACVWVLVVMIISGGKPKSLLKEPASLVA
jgi:hypothetical protein